MKNITVTLVSIATGGYYFPYTDRMLIVLIQEVVKLCLLIMYFVFSENCLVCLLTTTRTKQVGEYITDNAC